MPKFFVSKEDINGDSLTIREDAHHILHVLRRQAGEQLAVCDGRGQDYQCVIESLRQEAIQCRILSRRPSETEPYTRITVFQGLPKGEKTDWILQKAAELGVAGVRFVRTLRSIAKVDDGKISGKIQRWNKICTTAAKQCDRGVIPTVAYHSQLSACLSLLSDYDLVLLFYEEARVNALKEILRRQSGLPERVAIFVGPEGGWDPAEVRLLTGAGAQIAGLGPRILRTETAAMTAAAMILYEYDQM